MNWRTIGLGSGIILLFGLLFSFSAFPLDGTLFPSVQVPSSPPLLYTPASPSSLSFEPEPPIGGGGNQCYIKVRFVVVHAGTVASSPALLKEVWSPEKKKALTMAAFGIAKGAIDGWYSDGKPPAPALSVESVQLLTAVDDIKKYFGNTVIKDSAVGFFGNIAPTFKDKIVVYSTSDGEAYSKLKDRARKDVPDDTIVFFVVDELYLANDEAWGLYYENYGFGLLSYESLLKTYVSYKQQDPSKAATGLARAFAHELGHAQTLDDAEPGNNDNLMCSFFTGEACTDSFTLSDFQKRSFRAHGQGKCVEEGNYAPKIAGVYSVKSFTSSGICGNRKSGVEEECENDWFNDIPASKIKSSTFENPSYCMAVINGKYVSINNYNVNTYKLSHPDKVKICNVNTCKCEPVQTSGGSSISHPPLIAVGTPEHTYVDPAPNPGGHPSPGPGGNPPSSHGPVVTPPSCAVKKESTECPGAVICMDTPQGECLDETGNVVCYCTAEDGCYNPYCPADGYCPKLRDPASGELVDQICQTLGESCGCAPTPSVPDPEELSPPEGNDEPEEDPFSGGNNPP